MKSETEKVRKKAVVRIERQRGQGRGDRRKGKGRRQNTRGRIKCCRSTEKKGREMKQNAYMIEKHKHTHT